MFTVPDASPATTPAELTVATEGFELLQLPPPVPTVSELLDPTQTNPEPKMVPATGRGLIVTDCIA